MKRQIALVGGQLVPVYLGIRERNPEHVHLIYSDELVSKVKTLKSQFNSVVFSDHIVDPYDFQELSDLVESLVFENDNDSWGVNLTGGTKVMTLAAHNIFKELDFDSFYIDQSNRLFSFKEKLFTEIETDIKITTFLKLSGHTNIRKSTLSAYDKEEFGIAEKMLELMQDSDVDLLFRTVASKVRDHSVKSFKQKLDSGAGMSWSSGTLMIKTAKSDYITYHPNAFFICFSGLWWELVVASAVRSWSLKKEMLVGVELLANTDEKFAKNEIDIIMNTGKNMVFIECKAGNVKQEDINKMRVVKRLYGGIASRSILVCYKLPRKDLLEKCVDLDIDVFALQRRVSNKSRKGYVAITSLEHLNTRLTKLIGKKQV